MLYLNDLLLLNDWKKFCDFTFSILLNLILLKTGCVNFKLNFTFVNGKFIIRYESSIKHGMKEHTIEMFSKGIRNKDSKL